MLAALPTHLRIAFEQAIALSDQLEAALAAQTWSPAEVAAGRDAAQHAAQQAMAALGLPRFEPYRGPDGGVVGYVDRPVLRAEALTETQRMVLTALVERSDVFGGAYPVPSTAWARRQWLDLDPPGPLWASGPDGAPRYFDLRQRLEADEAAFNASISSLPVPERVPLLYELDLLLADLWGDQARLIQEVMAELSADLGPWAVATAERALLPVPRAERSNRPHVRAQLVFAALVKAGVPIEPRYEPLLRVHQPKPMSLIDDWIAALPEPRREAALLAALDHLTFTEERVRLAARLLPRWPLPGLAVFAEANLKASRHPKEVRQALKDASAAHPPIKKALAAWKKAQPKPLKLKRTASAALADLLPLDAIQTAQLEAAALEYNGVVCSAAAIIAGRSDADEPILPDTIYFSRFEGPRGEPAFELWSLMGDSGTFFRAGTTEAVGGIIQFDVACDDPVLQAALQLALRGA